MIRFVVLMLVGLAGTGSAWAGAEPYVRSRTDAGACIYWPQRKYVYSVNRQGSARTPGDTELAAIDAAFATWRSVAATCSDFRFERGAQTDQIEIGYYSRGPNENIILFREVLCDDVVPSRDDCRFQPKPHQVCGNKYHCWFGDDDHSDLTYASTLTTFRVKSGEILDADIEFNAARHLNGTDTYLFTTVNSPACGPEQRADCIAADLQNTLTHEIGHAVGFDHASNEGSTMYLEAQLGETKKRVIDFGTSLGFCDLYTTGVPPPPCDSLGTVQSGQSLNKRVLANGVGTGCSSVSGGAGLLTLAAVVMHLLRSRTRRNA